MTNRHPIPDHAVLVAIDIAKHKNAVLIERPGSSRRRNLTVINSRAEHDRLVDELICYGCPVVCAFEATGNYHRPLGWRLIEAGFDVRLVSSLALARTREALHGGWDKNDPKDAQVILHMIKIGAAQPRLQPEASGLPAAASPGMTAGGGSRRKRMSPSSLKIWPTGSRPRHCPCLPARRCVDRTVQLVSLDGFADAFGEDVSELQLFADCGEGV